SSSQGDDCDIIQTCRYGRGSRTRWQGLARSRSRPAAIRWLRKELAVLPPDRIVPIALPPGLFRRRLGRQLQGDRLHALRLLRILLQRAGAIVIIEPQGFDHIARGHGPVPDADEILAIVEIGILGKIIGPEKNPRNKRGGTMQIRDESVSAAQL